MVETNSHNKHIRSWEYVQLSLCKFLSKNPLLQQGFGGKPSSFLSTKYQKPFCAPCDHCRDFTIHLIREAKPLIQRVMFTLQSCI